MAVIWGFVFGVFINVAIRHEPPRFQISQTTDQRFVLRALEASAEKWYDRVQFAGRFDYSTIVTRQNGKSSQAKTSGIMQIAGGYFGCQCNWSPIRQDVYPFQSFSFLGDGKNNVFYLVPCIVAHRHLKIVDPSFVHTASTSTRMAGGTRSIPDVKGFSDPRLPINKFPNVISFCGGFPGPVAMGGFESGPNGFSQLETAVEKNGISTKAEFENDTFPAENAKVHCAISDNKIEVFHKILAGERRSYRRLVFEKKAGFFIKTGETYTSRKNGIETLHKEYKVTGFEIVRGIHVPLNLACLTRIATNGGLNTLERTFSIRPSSIAPLSKQEMNIPVSVDGGNPDSKAFLTLDDLPNKDLPVGDAVEVSPERLEYLPPAQTTVRTFLSWGLKLLSSIVLIVGSVYLLLRRS